MKNFIFCPYCNSLIAYNSYFSGYTCNKCGTVIPKNDYKNVNISISSECELQDCPVGLFLHDNELCLKTEYGLDSYIVSSGEMFWGGVSSREELAHVKVRPYLILERNYEDCD